MKELIDRSERRDRLYLPPLLRSAPVSNAKMESPILYHDLDTVLPLLQDRTFKGIDPSGLESR